MERTNRLVTEPSPRELASNLRDGRQNRRFQPTMTPPSEPLPGPTYVDLYAAMLPVSGLLGHGAPRTHGWRKLKRVMQRFAKAMIKPWLELQTRFNHATLDQMSQLQARNTEHGQRLTQRVNELLPFVNRNQQFHSRLNDCFYDQHQQGLRLGREIDQLHAAAEEHRHQLDTLMAEAKSDRAVADKLHATVAELTESIQSQTESHAERFKQLWQTLHQATATIEKLRESLEEVQKQPAPPPAGPPLKDLINRELCSLGRIAEAGLYFNPPITVEYDPEKPQVSMITERILEGIFVHSRLPQKPVKLLDMGCAESINAIEMASLGHDVTGVDLRPLPVKHSNFKMVLADLCDLPFEDESFECVVALSTLEHVGLGWYTDEPEKNDDIKALEEGARVLKSGGRFITTVPFGKKAGETKVHRIYDQARLDRLLAPLKIVEIAYGVRDGETWNITHDAKLASAVDSIARVSAVALIVAEKE